jgi:hypothetical protein
MSSKKKGEDTETAAQEIKAFAKVLLKVRRSDDDGQKRAVEEQCGGPQA